MDRSTRPAELLDLVRRASRVVTGSSDFDSALRRIVDLLRVELGWAIGHVWRPRLEPLAELRATGSWSVANDTPDPTEFRRRTERRRYHPGEGLLGQAWATRRSIWVADLGVDPRFLRDVSSGPLPRSGLVVPVTDGRETAAVFELLDVEVRPEDPVVRSAVDAVAGQLWLAFERERALSLHPTGQRHCLMAIDRGPDVFVVVDRQGRASFWSSAWKVVLGHADVDLDPSAPFGLFHPTDRPAVREAYRRCARASDPSVESGEARLLDGDGSWRRGRVRVVGLGSRPEIGSAIVSWDERVSCVDDSRRDIDLSHPGVWCVDERGVTLYVNRRMTEICGVPASRLVGRPIAEVLDERERSRAEARIQRRRAGVRETYEFRFHPPDGEERVTLVEADPVRDARGAFRGSVAIVTDITPLARAREHLTRAERLHFRADRLEAIGQLAGGVAHDFNNLLTALLGYAEEARVALDPDHPARESIIEVERVVERADRLISQLLAYGRREPLEPGVIALDDAIRDMKWLVEGIADGDVRREISLEPDTPEIRIDPGQLERVLVNLVVNARDAMPDGGTLRITTRGVRLDEPIVRSEFQIPTGHWALLEVTDEGVGMDAGTRGQIFEPFFTTKEDRGTGLGLATVYSVVKRSDGFVLVDSEPAEGARFRVYLPASEGASREANDG